MTFSEEGYADGVTVKRHRQTNSHSLLSSLSNWAGSMFDEIPGHGLVLTRVLWGLIFMYQTIRYMDDVRIRSYYAPAEEGGPHLQFRYWPFGEDFWPPRISIAKFWILLKVNLVFGFMMATGCLYHIATAVLWVNILFIYLQESTLYLNHMYLALLLQFVFIFLPANRMLSIDSKLGIVKRSNTVPRWSVWIIRFITSNVYVWAGIAKMNKDWLLHALPLRFWLPRRIGRHPNLPFFDTIMGSTKAAYIMSWTGCIYDTFLPALLHAGGKWRWFGFALSVVFHTSNKLMFNIGIFPIFCVALSFLYFDFDWPLKFTRTVLRWVFNFDIDEKQFHVNTRYRSCSQNFNIKEKITLAFVLMLSVHQVLVPGRHFLRKGDVAWNERGHMYSWRMKLRDKAGFLKCAIPVEDPDQPTGLYRWKEVAAEHLVDYSRRSAFVTRPEEIHQFAHWVGGVYKAMQSEGDSEEENSSSFAPAVHCFSINSLNCRDPQFLINPLFNLAEIPLLSDDEYIIEKLPDDTSRDHPLIPQPLTKYDHKEKCSGYLLEQSYRDLLFDDVWQTFLEAAEAGLVAKPPKIPSVAKKEEVCAGDLPRRNEETSYDDQVDKSVENTTAAQLAVEDDKLNETTPYGVGRMSVETTYDASDSGVCIAKAEKVEAVVPGTLTAAAQTAREEVSSEDAVA